MSMAISLLHKRSLVLIRDTEWPHPLPLKSLLISPDPVVQQQPRLQMSQPQYGHPLFRTICNAVPTFDGMPGSNVDTWIVSYDRLTRDLTAMERQLIPV